MDCIYLGASIECDAAGIGSRKITRESLVELPNVGRCIKYSCEINSECKIEKELNPKHPICKNTSHLDLGDKLKAQSIVVYVKGVTSLKIEVERTTTSHRAGTASSRSFTFSEITCLFPNLLVNDPKQVAPSPKKLLSELPSQKPNESIK